MKIAVALKRVVDYNIQVRPNIKGDGVETQGLKMSINPFDENALEEAIQLKEKGIATEVIAVTIGTQQHQDILRQALAMGIDRVVILEHPGLTTPLQEAKIFAAFSQLEQPNLWLTGKQAIDDDSAQMPSMLAAILKWPQATAASRIVLEKNQAFVTREIEGGTETWTIPLPSVISTDLRLNNPRFVKLPALMMAKKKTIASIPIANLLDLQTSPQVIRQISQPAARQQGIEVKSVKELVQKLRHEKGALT